jgi:hypothetical protein
MNDLTTQCIVVGVSLGLAILIGYIACSAFMRKKSHNTKRYSLNQILSSDSSLDVTQIPKKIWMTYHKKENIPSKVFTNLATYADNYTYTILDDKEGIQFIQKYFGPEVVEKFDKLSGAHKADLLRYCLLYVHGGVYIDIKTVLVQPLDGLISSIVKQNSTRSTAPIISTLSMISGTVYQGVIATPPKQEFFLKLIEFIVKTPTMIPKVDYLIFTRDFFAKAEEDVGRKIEQGLNVGKSNTFYFFQEICSPYAKDCPDGLDRYNLCCYIHDGSEKVIKTRYSDFPWHSKK